MSSQRASLPVEGGTRGVTLLCNWPLDQYSMETRFCLMLWSMTSDDNGSDCSGSFSLSAVSVSVQGIECRKRHKLRLLEP